MNSSSIFRPGIVAATAVAVVASYIFLSAPGAVAVDEAGEVIGTTNSVRAWIQGKRFWRDQLQEIQLELSYERSWPQRKVDMNRNIDAALSRSDDALEQLYSDHPDLRPSPEERKADALRNRADQIENAEADHLLEQLRLKRIRELQSLLPVVQARTE